MSLGHYTHDKQAPPAIVIEYTNSLKGDAVEPMEVRFGNIVRKSEDSNDVVFYKEIRMLRAQALDRPRDQEFVLCTFFVLAVELALSTLHFPAKRKHFVRLVELEQKCEQVYVDVVRLVRNAKEQNAQLIFTIQERDS